MKKSFFYIVALVFIFSAYSVQVRGESVTQVNLADVIANPGNYMGKKIELSGCINLLPRHTDRCILEDCGASILCYERGWRIESPLMPVMAMRQAERNHEMVQVIGKLEKAGENLRFELYRLECNSHRFNTNMPVPH